MANGLLGQRADQSYRSKEDLDANRGMATIGAALIEEGMEKLGSPKTGKAVGDYLRQEWWRQEANTFQATTGKDVQDRMTQNMTMYKNRTKLTSEIGVEGQDPAELRKGYYSEFDGNGAAVPTSFIPSDDPMAVNQHLNSAASDMIGGLQGLSMEYMDAAGEYPNNPLVKDKAEGLMNHITNTFQGQLTAAKIAGEKMQSQSDAMDMEKKQQQAEIDAVRLPNAKRLALAEQDQKIDTISRAKSAQKAEVDRGKALLAADGHDPEALSDDDAMAYYLQDRLQLEDDIKRADLAKKTGRRIVPEGVTLDNIGDALKHDPSMKGLLGSFMNDAKREAFATPEVKRVLDDAAMAMTEGPINKKGERTIPGMPYDKLPEIGDPKSGTIGKDDVRNNVFLNNKELYDGIEKSAITEATKYLLSVDQLGGPLGINGIPVPNGNKGMRNVKLYQSPEEALQLVVPELFVDEVEAKYADKLADPGFSGDPEDPFGPASEPTDSAVAEEAPSMEAQAYEAAAKWYDEFAPDKTIPLSEKKRQARKMIRQISTALQNGAERQALDQYGLPPEEYRDRTIRLLELRSNLFAITHMKADDELPDTLASDIADLYANLYDAAVMIHENGTRANQEMIEGVAGGVEQLGLPGITRKQGGRAKIVKFLNGIFPPSNGGILPTPAQVESGVNVSVPYWMASEEEKQARTDRFNKSMKSGGIL